MDASVSPKALVFDWGDTLMTTFPEYQGVMVDWPVVAAEDGAAAALAQLKGHYRLLVGTNAANSSASQVLAALQRVGLSQSIERVFTVHELGSRKPEAAFYQALQSQTGLSAGELVMVGDDYSVDVLGAWQAGWRTVWYNPKGKAAPGLLPVQDQEIGHLSELPAALETAPLPRLADCMAWLQRESVSAGLLAHIQAVAALAYQMALWLRAAGEAVDPLLAQRGGLLHDLAKLSPGEKDHGERAAEILLSRGQPALAEITRRHLLHRVLTAAEAPRTWEEKLVYLADKLVEGSRVVTLDERLSSLHRRYPRNTASIDGAAPHAHAIQHAVCARLGLDDEDLTPRLAEAMRRGG